MSCLRTRGLGEATSTAEIVEEGSKTHTWHDDVLPEEIGQLGEMAAVLFPGSRVRSTAVEDFVRYVSLALLIGSVLKDGEEEVQIAL